MSVPIRSHWTPATGNTTQPSDGACGEYDPRVGQELESILVLRVRGNFCMSLPFRVKKLQAVKTFVIIFNLLERI